MKIKFWLRFSSEYYSMLSKSQLFPVCADCWYFIYCRQMFVRSSYKSFYEYYFCRLFAIDRSRLALFFIAAGNGCIANNLYKSNIIQYITSACVCLSMILSQHAFPSRSETVQNFQFDLSIVFVIFAFRSFFSQIKESSQTGRLDHKSFRHLTCICYLQLIIIVRRKNPFCEEIICMA